MGAESSDAFQEVPVTGESCILGQRAEPVIGYLHDLQFEKEKFPAHQVAELRGALRQCLVQVIVGIGGKEKVGIKLWLYDDFLDFFEFSKCFQQLACIVGCHFPGVFLPE